MSKRIVTCGLGVSFFLFVGSLCAQQNIGNSVYICDGAAQAGPCQLGGDEGYSSGESRPVVKWADRWGAFAEDKQGSDGVIAGQKSERQARTAAISECRKRGGKKCQVVMTYYNQCAAIAAGDRGSIAARAETKELAIQDSLQSCERKSGNCRVYYSGCSLPERIQ